MEKIVTTMGECEYYASIYYDFKVGHIVLGSEKTTTAYAAAVDRSLPDLYATVIVFTVRAAEYFSQPLHGISIPFQSTISYLVLTLCRESGFYFGT